MCEQNLQNLSLEKARRSMIERKNEKYSRIISGFFLFDFFVFARSFVLNKERRGKRSHDDIARSTIVYCSYLKRKINEIVAESKYNYVDLTTILWILDATLV